MPLSLDEVCLVLSSISMVGRSDNLRSLDLVSPNISQTGILGSVSYLFYHQDKSMTMITEHEEKEVQR